MKPYLEMTKPRLLLMVLLTSAAGFFLGDAAASLSLLVAAIAGIGLTGAGASVLNQYIERDIDAKMERTRLRPIPSGKISPLNALAFGTVLVLAGVVFLALVVNLLTAFLALLTAFLYVLVYTPMKRLSWLNTSIGAIPGAIPPVAGWTAATGMIDAGAWLLFVVLFLWQHPHFFAIAWLYRDDYERGDLKMLPVVEADGRNTFRIILATSALLWIVSLAPARILGPWYFAGAFLLGASFLLSALALSVRQTRESARALFRHSLIYLPMLLLLLAI